MCERSLELRKLFSAQTAMLYCCLWLVIFDKPPKRNTFLFECSKKKYQKITFQSTLTFSDAWIVNSREEKTYPCIKEKAAWSL